MAEGSTRLEDLLISLSKKIESEHDVLKRLDTHEKECITLNKEISQNIEKLITRIEVLSSRFDAHLPDNDLTHRLAVLEQRVDFNAKILQGAGVVVGLIFTGIFLHLFEVIG